MLLQTEHLLLLLMATMFSIAILDQLLLNFLEYFVTYNDLQNLSSYPTLIFITIIGCCAMVLCGFIPNILLVNKDPSHILKKICFKEQ